MTSYGTREVGVPGVFCINYHLTYFYPLYKKIIKKKRSKEKAAFDEKQGGVSKTETFIYMSSN